MTLPIDTKTCGGRITTPNINLAAALCAAVPEAYMDREGLEITDPRHVVIPVVGDEEKLKEAQRKWDTRTLVVNARVYSDYLKDAKSMIIQATGKK